MAKNLKFTGLSHRTFFDFGFRWEKGDEHIVEDKVADLAHKTFPDLFVIVESHKKDAPKKDAPKEKKIEKEETDNKMFGRKKDK